MVEKPVSMAMNKQALVLMDMQRDREAIALHDDVIERFKDTYNTELAEQVAIARLNRGLRSAIDRPEEAFVAYEDVVELPTSRSGRPWTITWHGPSSARAPALACLSGVRKDRRV